MGSYVRVLTRDMLDGLDSVLCLLFVVDFLRLPAGFICCLIVPTYIQYFGPLLCFEINIIDLFRHQIRQLEHMSLFSVWLVTVSIVTSETVARILRLLYLE